MAGSYCTLQQVRDAGITISMMSDARVTAAIKIASNYIEAWTGQWFEARSRTLLVDGRGTPILHLQVPVISVSAVNNVSGRGASIGRYALDVDDLVIYNRHLTKGLEDPDDRANPKIAFAGQGEDELGEPMYPGLAPYFTRGRQNYEVTGKFGYTVLDDGVTPAETSDGSQVPANDGVTPPLINQACLMLVAREIGGVGELAKRRNWRNMHRVTSEKTADQSYTMASPGSLGLTGAWSGDPDIDRIIDMYLAPAKMGGI